MRLAMCIEGNGASLVEGKVYEVSPSWICKGDTLVEVPSAPNYCVLSHLCQHCGRDFMTAWFARRFIPINDTNVKEDEKRDEEVTA